jgi:hypothetical protein
MMSATRGSVVPTTTRSGLSEVLDRGALLEELGVRYDFKIGLTLLKKNLADLVGGSDGNGALHDDDEAGLLRLGQARRDSEDGAQVRSAVRTGWRADTDKGHLRAGDRGLEVRGEAQSLFSGVALDKVAEPRLVDRDHSIT